MNEELKIASKLLSDFRNYASKRSSFFMSHNALPPVLEWHIQIWRKEVGLLGQGGNTLDLWSLYSQLDRELDSILADITNRVLTEATMDSFIFFDEFKKHIAKYKDEKIKVKENDHTYAQHFLGNFFRIFFEKIEASPDRRNIWEHYFPDSLKVHSATVVTDTLQHAVLNQYLPWAGGRIGRTNAKKEYDSSLDEVTENLFPEVDPILWAEILTFVFSPYNPKDRLKYVIEQRPLIFGSSRMTMYSGYVDDKEDSQKKATEFFQSVRESEKDETLKMLDSFIKIIPLFHQTFSKENLLDLIRQSEALTYPEDSENEERKKTLTEVFKELLAKLEKSVKQ